MSTRIEQKAAAKQPLSSMSPRPVYDPLAQRERIPVRVFPHSTNANKAVAAEIAALIRERAAEGRSCVLGLATGSTPVGVYDELVRLHREEGLSLANVITFNLDEYFPMQTNELQSYVRFMHEHLFDLVDIPKANCHVPDGTLPDRAGGRLLRLVRGADRRGRAASIFRSLASVVRGTSASTNRARAKTAVRG